MQKSREIVGLTGEKTNNDKVRWGVPVESNPVG